MTAKADFPVTWDTPEEERLLWIRDESHYPRPVSPLTASLLPLTVGAGITLAAEELRMAFQLRLKVINGWVYNAAVPMVPREHIPQRLREHMARMQEAIRELPERWAGTYQPELERDIAGMKAFDLGAADTAHLLDHLEAALALNRRHWEIHMLTAFPVFAACAVLAHFYREVMGPGDESAPYRLLQGEESKTLEVGDAFARLVELARTSTTVRQALLHAPAAATDARALPRQALARTEDGRRFQAAFEAFLDGYGYRSTGSDDLADVTWREDPSFVLDMLRAGIRADTRDPREIRRTLVAEREAMIAAVRQRIGADVESRHQFDELLAAAQAVWPLRETHAFYIDQTSQALLRYALLEGGRRLAAAGALSDAHDVFYLTFQELLDGLRVPGPGLRTMALERRAQNEGWAQLLPPPGLGRILPFGVPPASGLPGFLGWRGLPREGGRTIVGVAASAGRAVGPARLVLSPADFPRVQPGDVLVCPTTTPPWTPLFAVIAALVTDSGGALSHGAILARGYGRPAVMGTNVATREILDGQRVEVDGTTGQVRLLP